MANHKNFAQTTLGAAITDTSGTSITVTSETSFPSAPFIISIDTECFLVSVVSGTTWTVTRGYEGSTAATHLNGAAIFHDISAAEADVISSITAAGLALIDDANAAAQLTTLGAAALAGATFTGAVEAADHGTAATDQVVNVCYGTADPPEASTTTEGALFIKYTA